MTTHSTRTLRALEELRNCVYPFFEEVPCDYENAVIELRKREYDPYHQTTGIVVMKDGSLDAYARAHDISNIEKIAAITFSAELVVCLGELCAALREERKGAK